MRTLTEQEAQVFAEMLWAGVPSREATRMLVHPDEDQRVAEREWAQQPEVIQAIAALDDGRQWHELSDRERHERALRQHYASLSFFLWSTNYAELVGEARSKADAARVALEAKVSGTAGQQDAVSVFYKEVLAKFEAQRHAREEEEEEGRELLAHGITLPQWDD